LKSRKSFNNGLQLRIASAAHFYNDVEDTISCEDKLKFMRRLPDESMKLIVTSSPH
jgi:hypothetical protein